MPNVPPPPSGIIALLLLLMGVLARRVRVVTVAPHTAKSAAFGWLGGACCEHLAVQPRPSVGLFLYRLLTIREQ